MLSRTVLGLVLIVILMMWGRFTTAGQFDRMKAGAASRPSLAEPERPQWDVAIGGGYVRGPVAISDTSRPRDQPEIRVTSIRD